MKIIFTFSVMLNILLLGITGSMVYKKMHRTHVWKNFGAELEPESRHIVARRMQQSHREARPLQKKASQARKNMMAELTAEDFNAGKFDKAVAVFRSTQTDLMSLKIDALRDIAGELDQEERKKLAAKINQMFDRAKRARAYKKEIYNMPPKPEEAVVTEPSPASGVPE